MKEWVVGLVLVILVAGLAVSSIGALVPPAVVPASASAVVFSAERALGHLEAIAHSPRPMGTDAHTEARQTLLRELEALGLEPQVQVAATSTPGQRPGWTIAGTVYNVLARLEGTGDGKAILLASHYDSVASGPGAADDGAAVAAMLEVLRALKAGEPLRNDVIFAFTDGEETGLLGARAFVDEHPWADDVGVVLNFEARGTRGPSLMFETSPGNGRLIRSLQRSAARPFATSISSAIYKLLPNQSDFREFSRAEMPGLNFAFIHGATGYHTALDSIERLDPRSLQHHGDYALALVRDLGGLDLATELEGRDAVYFNLFGGFLVAFSSFWIKPLVLFLILATVIVISQSFGKRITPGGLLAGLAANFAAILASAILLSLLVSPVFRRGYNFWVGDGASSTAQFLVALALVAIGLTIALVRLARRWVSADDLVAAGLLLWMLLAVVVSILIPGASYLFALPLLLALVVALVWFGRESGKVGPVLALGLAASAALATLLWAPALALIGVALGGGFTSLMAMCMTLVLFGPLAPQLHLATDGRRGWILAGLAVVAGIGMIFALRSETAFGPENPFPNGVIYVADLDAGEAHWASPGPWLDEWTSQFLPEDAERQPLPSFLLTPLQAFTAEAPMPPPEMGGARLELLGREVERDRQTLRLRLSWPHRPHRASVVLETEGEIQRLGIGGRPLADVVRSGLEGPEFRAVLRYGAPPAEGIELEVEMSAGESLRVDAVGQTYGLPEPSGGPAEARGAEFMPMQGAIIDSTLVRNVQVVGPDDLPVPGVGAPEPVVDESSENSVPVAEP